MDVWWILSRLLAFLSAVADPGFPGCPAIAPLITESSRFGEEAVPHSWPWQVWLDMNGKFCGGSLINESWVLTAAHCSVEPRSTRVILGQHDSSSYFEYLQIQIIEVGKAFVHPRYDRNGTRNNDVQLIKLARPAKFGMHVSPVCLAETSDHFPDGMMCVGSGWADYLHPHSLSPALRQTSLPLLTNKQCERLKRHEIMDQMICAGASGASPCFGDSGGPLVCEMWDGAWTLVGVSNLASPTCDPTMPGVYARVSEMRAWIDRTIAAN